MKEEYPLHIKLAGSAADNIFIPQPDDISCGPACLASVAKVYRAYGLLPEKEKFGYSCAEFAAEALPRADTGTPQSTMKALCQTFLPYKEAGSGRYQGGVAIANIIQDGEGHYVVFLCKERDIVLYYDPSEHEFVLDKIDDIDWRSGFEGENAWSIEFKDLPDSSLDRWLNLAAQKAGISKAAKKANQPKKPT